MNSESYKKLGRAVALFSSMTLLVSCHFPITNPEPRDVDVSKTPATSPSHVSIPECRDNIDNNGDSFRDWPMDPHCSDRNDDSESR